MVKSYCFIHICCTPKGLSVIEDQITLMHKTGLYDKLSKIYIGALGDYQKFMDCNVYKNNDDRAQIKL